VRAKEYLGEAKGVAGGGISNPLCPPFSDYSFWVHHPVNRDDRHILAHAMASDFSVAWQYLSKRTIVFSLRIKLHACCLDKLFPQILVKIQFK
jgi:hypothetical protein